ncbi:MAG: hypothetical protein AVDCRST_MAG87-3151, partial [uncultured Thermomicrobiales bacterium]
SSARRSSVGRWPPRRRRLSTGRCSPRAASVSEKGP